ncbi:MAG: hypothetical protein ACO3JL_19895, partial [Myxococcota bacterium]
MKIPVSVTLFAVLVLALIAAGPACHCGSDENERDPASLTEAALLGYWKNEDDGIPRVFTFRGVDNYHVDLVGEPHTYEILGAQRGGYRVAEGALVTTATADTAGLGTEGYSFRNEILSFFDDGRMTLAVDTDFDGVPDAERLYVRSRECPREEDRSGALQEARG